MHAQDLRVGEQAGSHRSNETGGRQQAGDFAAQRHDESTAIIVPQDELAFGLGPNVTRLWEPSKQTPDDRVNLAIPTARRLTSAAREVVNFQRITNTRYVFGGFQITIPVSVKSEMLVPEERILSVMRWIQESIKPNDRWYPVFIRYLEQLAGRVDALGGDANSVPATQTGIWPGLFRHKDHRHSSFTGKVDGIVYDRFGDFQAFILATLDGERRRFESYETRVLRLVERAWEERILTTVVVHRDHPERLLEILLHGAPPPFEG